MTDLLLQIGISNLCVSVALALVAWAVQARGRRPVVAHLLWLLVLAKLVTPPLVTVPFVAVPGLSATSSLAGPGAPGAEAIGSIAPPSLEQGKTWLVLLWAAGSAFVLAWSLVRIYRFDRLLGMASEAAPPRLQRLASELGQRLGLTAAPAIHTTSAHLSPMVWWTGGRVRVFIPAALPRELDAAQLRWILAHELAHVRRRDHLVRWLEWLACVGFWWNPVAWWARRNLRANEEVCCDALVLDSLEPDPRTYASSLLNAIELLASPALRPPAMASEINGGRFLERRFRMIVSSKPIPNTPRWLQALVLLFAVGLLPLGVARAQDPDRAAVGARLKAAVAAGELTPQQARAMMAALGKPAGAAKQQPAKKQNATGRNAARSQAAVRLAKLKEDLDAAVKAGTIDKRDAAKKYRAAAKAVRQRMAADRRAGRSAGATKQQPTDDAKASLAKLQQDLAAAVKSGRITKQQAVTRLQSAKKKLQAQNKAAGRAQVEAGKGIDRAALRKRLNAAVESGRMTKEQARAKLAELRKAARAQKKRDK